MKFYFKISSFSGVLTQIQDYFQIDDGRAGLLQTAFICSYMFMAPLFGYLGDRYNRKYLIVCGITFWSLMTLIGSFVSRDVSFQTDLHDLKFYI